MTVEKEYSINFTVQQDVLYKEMNSDMSFNCVEIYKFKAKDSEINGDPLCLVNISKDFSAYNMKKDWAVCKFDHSIIVVFMLINNILDIHKCLMVKNCIKWCLD